MSSFTSTAALAQFCPDCKGQGTNARPDQTNTQPGRPERLISFDEVHHRTGLSRTTIWRLKDQKDFRGRFKFPQAKSWREADVDQWIASKLEQSAP